MKSSLSLLRQKTDFYGPAFQLIDNALHFHGINLSSLLMRYPPPLKLSYLPKIGASIQQARQWFLDSMQARRYTGKYTYCYSTKASQFAFVLNEVLAQGVGLEVSSAYDMKILDVLAKKGKLNHANYILCNGFKPPSYIQALVSFINNGFQHCIPILDNKEELDAYTGSVLHPFDMGLRVAVDEESAEGLQASRLGIPALQVIPYYEEKIAPSHARLKILHFFVPSGIKDTSYFWAEFERVLETYCELKKRAKSLDALDLGGGLPVQYALNLDFDYAAMVDKIIERVQQVCDKNRVAVPHLFTEFGTYSVAESGALFYPVLGQKHQQKNQEWYIVEGSFISQLPDSWALKQRYVLLPVNHWDKDFQHVRLGGLSCDSMDCYTSQTHQEDIFLPTLPSKNETPLYIGFFHTGAYQDALGGYGGIQHCLLPAPKHLLISRNEKGERLERLFCAEQSSDSMLNWLGYDKM